MDTVFVLCAIRLSRYSKEEHDIKVLMMIKVLTF